GVQTCALPISAKQDYEDEQRKLEQKKATLLKEIKDVQSLLNINKKKERDVLGELSAQNRKIKLQQDLIANSRRQERNLANDIYVNTDRKSTRLNSSHVKISY